MDILANKLNLKPATLKFLPELEIKYKDRYYRESLPVLRVAMATSILLFALFGILDLMLVDEYVKLFLWIRFGIVIPFFIGVFLISFTPIFKRIWQGALFLSFLIIGIATIAMIVMSPDNWSYYGGLLLIFSAGYFFIRLRFILASLAGWLLTAIFIVIMIVFTDISPLIIIPYSLFFVSANLIGMSASFFIEISNRRNFMLNNQLEIKQQEQEEINKKLELMVRVRTLELKESEERFRNLADLLPLMVFEVDLHGKINYANEEVFMETGLTRNDIIKGTDLSTLVAEEDKSKVLPDYYREYEIKGKTVSEYRLKRKDGSVFPVVDYSNTILRENQVVGLRSILVDVSEQKKAEKAIKASEEKYKLLSENAFDGIYLAYGSRFDYVNKRMVEITGYSELELLDPGFDWYELLTPGSKDVVDQRLKLRKENKFVPTTYEFQIVTKSGEIKDIELSSLLLSHEPEMFFLGVARDITEKKINETLRNEITITRKSAEFKQQFLANMSHEIRTPLTGIMGIIEILSATNLDHKQREYLKTLEISTENLREIINQILDYSKIEAGKIVIRPVPFHTGQLVENARNLFEALCRDKPVTFETHVANDVPLYLKSDKQRVNQVITNFISNAVKFTPKGDIRLKAEIHRWIDRSNLVIRIEVQDSGTGIHKEKQRLLFKPFSQLDDNDINYSEGTGLGLSISRELVKLFDGRIGVRSTPGKGSTFWFTFAAEVVSQEVFEEHSRENPKHENGNSLRILVVEDKIVNQKVIGLILTSMGHTVETANNGSIALQIFQPGKYDLILMDIQMPVMDGITATRLLKEKYKDLPPIAGLSANAFEGDRANYMALGMDEYITKPVKKDDIVTLVNRLGI
jgi:PAS domain S-box-containing protein